MSATKVRNIATVTTKGIQRVPVNSGTDEPEWCLAKRPLVDPEWNLRSELETIRDEENLLLLRSN
jgi:hypothetical protein